jgi:uncharacterized membrane protein
VNDYSSKSIKELHTELDRLEHELDYQVHHKRIAELQECIEAIEAELKKRDEDDV